MIVSRFLPLVLLTLVCFSPVAVGQVPLVWADAPEATSRMFHKDTGVDAEGFVYSVSGIGGTVDFGRGPIVSPAGERGFSIAKYEPGGFFLSALGTGYSADTLIFDAAVSPNGDIYVVGFFDDDGIDLGGGEIENVNGGEVAFIVKYTKFLAFRWAMTFDAAGGTDFRNVAVDADSNVYLYGTSFDDLDFGGGPLDPGAFVVKFNSGGNHQWSKSLALAVFPTDIAVYPSSSVVLVGQFGAPIDFGGGEITPTGSGDFFVVQFDASDGAHQWSSGFASGMPGVVATDPMDGVYVSATSTMDIDFGGGPLMNTGVLALYLAKFTAEGGHVWSRVQSTDAFNVFAPALGANGLGEVFVGGGINGAIDLGGGEVDAPSGMGGSFMYVAKYDATGGHIWSQAFGSTQSISGSSFSVGPANRVILGGAYSGIADLGTGPFPEVVTTTRAFVAGFFDTTVPIDPDNCFIATAAYGSPMADEVDTFRAVRDRYLMRSGIGTALVDAYYRTSPPVARFIENRPVIRAVTRGALTPALYYSRGLLASPVITLVLTLAICGLAGRCVRRAFVARRLRAG